VSPPKEGLSRCKSAENIGRVKPVVTKFTVPEESPPAVPTCVEAETQTQEVITHEVEIQGEVEEEVKKEEEMAAPVKDERRYLKLLENQGIPQEAYLLDIISKCSPKMLGQISTLHEHSEQMEWVGNCFMELVNLIIYERTELFEGWNQLQRYCSHKYDAY